MFKYLLLIIFITGCSDMQPRTEEEFYKQKLQKSHIVMDRFNIDKTELWNFHVFIITDLKSKQEYIALQSGNGLTITPLK